MAKIFSSATSDELVALGTQLHTIQAAALLKHNNGSLLTHLVGVWRVLRAGRVHADVARAGLIHSAYSTQFFKTRLFEASDRQRVARIYGDRTEQIAWLFCRIDRPLLLKARPPQGFIEATLAFDHETHEEIYIDARTANELVLLECANFVDQGYPGQSLGPYHAWALSLTGRGVALDFLSGRPHARLSEEAEIAAIKSYFPDSDRFVGLAGLMCAAHSNPFAAEPLIVSASIAIDEKRFDESRSALALARARLPVFGAAWDKRLSWPEWMAIIAALDRCVATRIRPSMLGNPVDAIALREWAIAEEIR